MIKMPKEIFAYHKEHGTGTWIDFDDSCRGDEATRYVLPGVTQEEARDAREWYKERDVKTNEGNYMYDETIRTLLKNASGEK